MTFLPVLLVAALLAVLVAWWLWRRRRTASQAATDGRSRPDDSLDTLTGWPPEAARVMTTAERRAYQLLVRGLSPDHIVLAQVPLARFIRVPARHSYREWMRRVGRLNADLLVCDGGALVLAVVNIRPLPERQSEKSHQRHERMDRVLRKAGIRVTTWTEDALPHPDRVQELVLGPARPVGSVASPLRSEPAVLERVDTDTAQVPAARGGPLHPGPCWAWAAAARSAAPRC